MKKRFLSMLLVLVLVVCLMPINSAAAGSFANFQKVNTYKAGQFTDVPASAWYASYVQLVYEYGLVHGKTATTFDPNNNLTIAEAIKLAVCLHSIYNTGFVSVTNGSPWYGPYVHYALSNGIIFPVYKDYTDFVTRAEFAVIFASAFPDEALKPINTIPDYAIPDVLMTFSYADAVYKLYRAGILTGNDENGSFLPGAYIKRSEVAAVVARMANPSYRVAVMLGR